MISSGDQSRYWDPDILPIAASETIHKTDSHLAYIGDMDWPRYVSAPMSKGIEDMAGLIGNSVFWFPIINTSWHHTPVCTVVLFLFFRIIVPFSQLYILNSLKSRSNNSNIIPLSLFPICSIFFLFISFGFRESSYNNTVYSILCFSPFICHIFFLAHSISFLFRNLTWI